MQVTTQRKDLQVVINALLVAFQMLELQTALHVQKVIIPWKDLQIARHARLGRTPSLGRQIALNV